MGDTCSMSVVPLLLLSILLCYCLHPEPPSLCRCSTHRIRDIPSLKSLLIRVQMTIYCPQEQGLMSPRISSNTKEASTSQFHPCTCFLNHLMLLYLGPVS